MRLKDAIASLQLGRKKEAQVRQLCTVWSEEASDGPRAVPLPEYPRPQFVRQDWRCLNGWWEYAFRAPGKPMGEADGQILVPFSPETLRSGVRDSAEAEEAGQEDSAGEATEAVMKTGRTVEERAFSETGRAAEGKILLKTGRTLQPGEVLWYRLQIRDLQLPEKRRLILHFGAVDERCTVWWNGQKAGSHRNGYLAFSFDVTEYVCPGTNELLVAVRDDTDQGTACRGKQTLTPGGMYYHAQSGIWQTVWLETVPEDYLANLRITPLPEKEAVQLELRFSGDRAGIVRVTVGAPEAENGSGRTVPDGSASGKPENGPMRTDTDSAAGSSELVFPKSRRMKMRIPVPEPRLWSPEDPALYPLRIEAGDDVVESYFAMRAFGTGMDAAGRPCLTLNGEPYFFHGVLDQGYWPESLMTPPSDAAMIHDISEMKELGFNMLRKHVKIETARWYYHCDRIGMVVWQDMVNGGGPVSKLLETYLPTIFPALGTHLRDSHYRLLSREDPKARKQFKKELLRMIRQLYNCPCIGQWVPFNEGWGQFDALRITRLIKKADPTRPVDHASGWFDQGGGDVRSVHNYFRSLEVEKDARAFVLSEYGGANCGIEGHTMSTEVYGYHSLTKEEYPQTFWELMKQIRDLSAQGLAGAVYTQLSDIEEETNGLLTYDRKVRKA